MRKTNSGKRSYEGVKEHTKKKMLKAAKIIKCESAYVLHSTDSQQESVAGRSQHCSKAII
jgi:hypothetical protein